MGDECVTLLGLVDESKGFLPFFQQIGIVVIVDANVEIFEVSRKEVVDLTRHIQYVGDVVRFELVEIRCIPFRAEIEVRKDHRWFVHLGENLQHHIVDVLLVRMQRHLKRILQLFTQLKRREC